MLINSEGMDLANLGGKESFAAINAFWKTIEITDLKYIESSHMNLSWFGKLKGADVVCQIGPETPKVLQEKDWHIYVTNYFSSKKYSKAKDICAYAESVGIPCPQILLSGVLDNKSWCVVEKAEGVGLDTIWDQIDLAKQKSILEDLGGYLAKLHSCEFGSEYMEPGEWYVQKIEGIWHNLLKTDIYGLKDMMRIKKDFFFKMDHYLPPVLTLTHNDILQKNILVDPKTLEIKSIIDWETGGIGDPHSDLLLGAWWISGEYGGSDELYQAMLAGYNKNITNKNLCLSLEKAKTKNPYMDIMWYLNILWIRKIMGDDSQTERRKGMVEKIVKELK